MNGNKKLPYWQVNVPVEERSEECPEWLQNLSEKDIGILSTPDSKYHRLTWHEVRQIVATNQLERFKRVPSELRAYRRFIWEVARLYNSVMAFIARERVQWATPVAARGRPFEFDDDVCILHNDWPYGLDRDIVHLVVWTKFALEDDPATGALTEQARAEIDAFVGRTFRSHVPDGQVIWFKNGTELKSVHALEHFHVMMLRPGREFVENVTKGDVPFCERG